MTAALAILGLIAVLAGVPLYRLRRSEQRLWRREGRLSAIIGAAPDPIITAKPSEGIVSFNAAAEQLFGCRATEVIGQPLERLIADPVAALNTGPQITRALRPDGREIPIEASSAAVESRGERFWTVMLRDISPRRAHDTELERLNRLYSALAQVSQAMTRITQRDALFETVCRILVEQGGFRMVWIGLPQPESKRLLPCAGWGEHDNYLAQVKVYIDDRPEGRGPSGLAYREGRPYVSNDLLKDPAAAPWHQFSIKQGLRSGAAFPIFSKGAIFGTLTVYASEINFFQDKEVVLLQDVAAGLSFALDSIAQEEAAARFAAIVKSTDDAIIATTLEGSITSWNPAAETMFGYTAAEIMGQSMLLLVPEGRESEPRSALERIRQGAHVQHFETERRHKDGHIVPVSITISPIHAAPESAANPPRIAGASAIMRDISERKRAEAAADRERGFSYQMLESMPGVMYFYTEDGHFLRWNQNFSRVTGYSAEEIARMHPLDFKPVEDWALLRERIHEVFDRGESYVESALLSKDGRVTPYYFTGRRLEFDGTRCLVGVGIDISRRKQAEAELQRYAARLQATSRQLLEVQENERRMLARDLHDTVGQELTALSLNLAMIRDALSAESVRAVGNRLDDSQRLLEDTTAHLRDVMIELRPPGIDELGLLAALQEHARRVARRSGRKLSVLGEEPAPRLSPTTAIALFRIAQEALNNTVKHARASEIVIDLRQDQGQLRLRVGDNGQGFALPEPAAQVPDGMGMTTMRERAEAIGAHLEVRSDVGRGTQVTVELQRGVAEAPRPH